MKNSANDKQLPVKDSSFRNEFLKKLELNWIATYKN
jgi:hypothetical protein